ncbi:hypothetical protein AYX14_00154 [Cryptococcus neoformans]|nr:hypothetical protein AYX15_04150 [Cryptococcus neoformans var. grubii]OWZ74216.1 hypothetical protein AYX14_00154 [Cryptococcus neoformans var. grubii]
MSQPENNGVGSSGLPNDGTGPSRPAPKRKSRSTRGLLNKVVALEDQMQHVQSNLENVVSLLLRLAPTALPAGSQVSTNPARHNIAQPGSNGSHNHVQTPSSGLCETSEQRPVSSLEQWVQQIAGNASSTTADLQQQSVPQDRTAGGSTAEGSEMSSEDERDHTVEEETKEGLCFMRDMLRSEERKRLHADGHWDSPREPGLSSHRDQEHITADGRADRAEPDGCLRNLRLKRKRGANDLGSPDRLPAKMRDPINLGFCSEAQGKDLFDMFFRGAHSFMPVFDPSRDSWESLRHRSPFCISAILFVGQKIKDAGHEPSNLQRLLREHAESIGKSTLFCPIADTEALQAMIILASWGDTGWRPGSHAVSMAIDMELYKCLPRLSERLQTPSAFTNDRDEDTERRLVIGSRLWLLVCKMAIEMAYNYGRPILIDEALIFPHLHSLLKHPAHLPTDSRIVAFCELLYLRLTLHKSTISGTHQELDQILQIFNDEALGWEERWRNYYIQQGVSLDNILVTDLTTQRCFGSVLANSCLLRDIRSPHDIERLSPHRRRLLLASLDDARLIASRVITTEKDKLLHANHYSHVALASVTRIYIRLATLLPGSVDLRKVARDLSQLTEVLARFPGFHFAQQLRYAISKARQKKILPPETRPTSPRSFFNHSVEYTRQNQPKPRSCSVPSMPWFNHFPPSELALQHHQGEIAPEQPGSTSNTMTSESPVEFDPFLAEHVLNETFNQVRPLDGISEWNPQPVEGENWNQCSQGGNQAGWLPSQPSVGTAIPDAHNSFLSWLEFPVLDFSDFDTQ